MRHRITLVLTGARWSWVCSCSAHGADRMWRRQARDEGRAHKEANRG